ncbi:lyase family protein [Rhodoferax koreense]|uniref:lyase family protein n=1 Tax=Rhodoferax koreensis TaxID=1842727 RepID=UPI0009F8977C|nr:lyase family protein [Rhodoferax koreense]
MSSIFEGFLSTLEVQEAFGDRRFVAAMLRFEAALARAQARTGLIPESAAKSIIGSCKVELFDVPKLVRDSGRAGSIAVPLVRSLQDAVGLFNPAAVAHTHFGCISQDVVDTAMALVTREALNLISADVEHCIHSLLDLAERHAATPMLARTLMQPASVISFGLKCAGWAAPLVRSRQRMRQVAEQALQLQLGGAVGTLAEMQGHGPEVARLMAEDLGLRAPLGHWQTQRDEWVALGCEFGLLVGSLGKMARDMALMAQFEIAELGEAHEPGRGGSSAMPHKRNPVGAMVALAAAQRAPQRVAALMQAMTQEHERALGHWQVELAEWPQLVMSAHGSARAMAQALSGLRIDTQRMLANLDAVRTSLPADAVATWFNPQLVEHSAGLTRSQVASLRSLLDARHGVAGPGAPAPTESARHQAVAPSLVWPV